MQETASGMAIDGLTTESFENDLPLPANQTRQSALHHQVFQTGRTCFDGSSNARRRIDLM